MIRFYILPIDRTVLNQRGPKYFKWKYDPDPPGIDCPWSMKDYGSIDMCTLATDITQSDHNVLVLNSDVYAFPEIIDTTMAQVERATLNAYLEAHALPGDWLSPGVTFRSALRTLTGMMMFVQKVCGILGYPDDPYAGITLNTQYRNIPNPLHDALSQAAQMFGFSWNISDNDQIRKILKMMADQWGSHQFIFSFTVL